MGQGLLQGLGCVGVCVGEWGVRRGWGLGPGLWGRVEKT